MRNSSSNLLDDTSHQCPPKLSMLVFVCAAPSECPAGMFGLGCRHRCQCDNKALCDHVSGACSCLVGWTGTFCEKRERLFDFFCQSHIVSAAAAAAGVKHDRVCVCVCSSVSSGLLRDGLSGQVSVSQRRHLRSRPRSLFLRCWLDRSLLQSQ